MATSQISPSNEAHRGAPEPLRDRPARPHDRRLLWVDFVRGVGVLSFIYWHAADYFYAPGEWELPSGRFVHYATGLFVFIAGLMIGLHYLPAARDTVDRGLLYRRLTVRAAKLFVFFVVGAVAKNTLENRASSEADIARSLMDLGMVLQDKRVPLQILFVIGCVLLSSPLALSLGVARKTKVMAAACLVPPVIELIAQRRLGYFWHYFLVGLWGSLAGCWLAEVWGRVRSRVEGRFWILCLPIGVLWFALQVSVTVYPRAYNLFLLWLMPNLLSIAINVAFWGLPILSRHDIDGRPAGRPIRELGLLGRHTLFVYVLQIVLINAIRVFGIASPSRSATPTVLVAVSVSSLCLIAGHGVERMTRHPVASRAYRFFFA